MVEVVVVGGSSSGSSSSSSTSTSMKNFRNALKHLLLKKGFNLVTGPPSFPGANCQQMVIARLSLRVIVFGLRNFLQNLKLCHDEKPCT